MLVNNLSELCLVPCPVFGWGPSGLLATGSCCWVVWGWRSLNAAFFADLVYHILCQCPFLCRFLGSVKKFTAQVYILKSYLYLPFLLKVMCGRTKSSSELQEVHHLVTANKSKIIEFTLFLI
jgi:hypothetical protein